MFVVQIAVQPPVVSAFAAFADVSDLKVETASPLTTLTIDSAGVRQALKEIDGILYSFQGNSVFLTNVTTGATQSRTLTGLAGSAGVLVRDVALVGGEVVYVGGSLTGNTTPTRSSIPTMWDIDGTPTRIGPAGKTGIANFIQTDGLIGGYYEKVANEYTPWLHSALGDFDLQGSAVPTDPQMVTTTSGDGFFLAGFAGNQPMVWQAIQSPETGEFTLEFSDERLLVYPDNAVLGSAGRNFKILQDLTGSISIFGQYEIPIVSQGNITGYESHAGMWSLSGIFQHDFGPNTEMLDVQVIGSTYIVAHRNSISFVSNVVQIEVTTRPLDDVLGSLPPPGATRKLQEDSLLLIGDASAPRLGVSYSETAAAGTRNKVAILDLKTPDQLELDVDNDGIWDEAFFELGMYMPAFEQLGYGQKSLVARVTYSDGSTVTAGTTYQSVPMDIVSNGDINELQVGGTSAADSATITQLAEGLYRVSIASQTRDFQSVDSVLVRFSTGIDTLLLAGGMTIDMSSLSGVEKIDTTAVTAEIISSVDSSMVEEQVGATGTLLIKAGIEDSIELGTRWTLEAPQLVEGRAAIKLIDDGKTLLLQTGNYTNPFNNLDTTFDGFISARDALLVINHINLVAAGITPPVEAYIDVNNNGFISALDVLLIINDINSRGAGEGEGQLTVEPRSVSNSPTDSQSASASGTTLSAVDIDNLPDAIGSRRRKLY